MFATSILGAFKRVSAEQVSDALAMAVVISLPWSTSVTASLIGLWLLSTLPFLRSPRLEKSLSVYDMHQLPLQEFSQYYCGRLQCLGCCGLTFRGLSGSEVWPAFTNY